MASYNKVILLGNLTRDPQLRYTPNQTAVVDIGLAVNRRWKDQSGQMREDVCFVDCTAFGKRGETINKYCKKGNPLLVEGRLVFDSWEAQDGSKRSKHKVTVESFQFVGGGAQGGQGGGGQGGQNSHSQGQGSQGQGSQDMGSQDMGSPAPMDDDIPF